MPFPFNSVLTNFTGTDEDPLSEGGTWGGPIRPTAGGPKPCARVGNQVAKSGTAAAPGESVYNKVFTPDQEVWFTVTTVTTTSGNEIDLNLRVTNENTSSCRCVLLAIEKPGASTFNWQWYWLNNTTYTAIGSAVSSQAVAAGDSVGATAVGQTFEAWYKPSAGNWTSLGTRQDPNITGAGKIGIFISANTIWTADDFGGGNLNELTGLGFPPSRFGPF